LSDKNTAQIQTVFLLLL